MLSQKRTYEDLVVALNAWEILPDKKKQRSLADLNARLSKENNLLEEKLTELEIQKLRLMKYKEIIKNAKAIWCDECNREYKPALFNAHLKVKCWEK